MLKHFINIGKFSLILVILGTFWYANSALRIRTYELKPVLAQHTPDAIAIRVIPNPSGYSALRWYQDQGFSGSPQALSVDGYEAIRDGRTVYVDAANVVIPNLYTNIYLISYNQDAEPATITIYNKLIANWNFNSNLTSHGHCVGLPQGGCGDAIACWHFNDNYLDYSGNNLDGREIGGVVFVPGVSGDAAMFDGANDYIEIFNNNTLNITNQITLSAWINPSIIEANNGWDRIIDKDHPTNYCSYCMGIGNSNEVWMNVSVNNVNHEFTSGAILSSGNWQHVVGTYDGDIIRLYVNGILANSLDVIPDGPIDLNNAELAIGVRPDTPASVSYLFDGFIDEVRIYDRALTDSEIAELLVRTCLTDADCPNMGYCTSDKAKVTRDTIRLARIYDIDKAIVKYFNLNGDYPKLESGSYVKAISLSVWPSWQATLGQALGMQLPVDPINQLDTTNCLAMCPGCDPITCWDAVNELFRDNAWTADLQSIPPVIPAGDNYTFLYKYGSYTICTYPETTWLPANIDCSGGCVTNCIGRNCGPDGCGGNCGICAASETCLNGQCVLDCPTSATGPGCLPSLNNGHIIPGYCATGSCYDCDYGYSWDGVANCVVMNLCGDGTCDVAINECITCLADCQYDSGCCDWDGTCDPGETIDNCPDCAGFCGFPFVFPFNFCGGGSGPGGCKVTCSDFNQPGCQLGAPANAEFGFGNCCGIGEYCYRCPPGHVWNALANSCDCVMSCNLVNEPNCQTSAPAGSEYSVGMCCNPGEQCYRCPIDTIWNPGTLTCDCVPTCGTGPGCSAGPVADAHPVSGDCCDPALSCWECNTGYPWGGASCSCAITCSTLPGCLAGLADAHPVGGECCDPALACYVCNTGWTWGAITQVDITNWTLQESDDPILGPCGDPANPGFAEGTRVDNPSAAYLADDWEENPGYDTWGFGRDVANLDGTGGNYDGMLISDPVNVPADATTLEMWRHLDLNSFDDHVGVTHLDGYYIEIRDAVGNSFAIPEYIESWNTLGLGNSIDWPVGPNYIAPYDISAHTSQTITIAIQVVGHRPGSCWDGDGDDALAQISDVHINAAGGTFGCLPPAAPPCTTFNFTEKWHWDGSLDPPIEYNQVMMTPIVADLDLDGNEEIIFNAFASGSRTVNGILIDYQTGGWMEHSEGILRVLNSDGTEKFNVTDLNYHVNAGDNIAVGNIDGDPELEIITGKFTTVQYQGIIAFEHDGSHKWSRNDIVLSVVASPAIADLDGNGTQEVIIGNYVLNGINGTDVAGWPAGPGTGNYVSAVANLDMVGSLEVVAGCTAYHADGSIYWNNCGVYPDGYVAVADLDGDSFPEIVLTDVLANTIRVFEHNGNFKWQRVISASAVGGGPPTIADFDSDGQPEIGLATANVYTVIENDGSINLWSRAVNDTSSAQTGSSVFDFNNDGEAEVLYADQEFFYIYQGSNGLDLPGFFPIANGNGTLIEYPVVADIDNDNEAEVVVPANNYGIFDYGWAGFGVETGIRVFENANPGCIWSNARPIWNQHTYHVTNILDNGTWPSPEQNNWQVPGLNNYRQNVPTFP